MIDRQPASHFLTCGAAEGMTGTNARDAARTAAGLGDVNLVATGPAVPAGCELVAARLLPDGILVPGAYADHVSATPGEVISAGVAVAYPKVASRPGVIMQYAASGHKEDIEAIVRRMAEEALRVRGLEAGEIHSVAVQHRVERLGAVFAAVVLTE